MSLAKFLSLFRSAPLLVGSVPAALPWGVFLAALLLFENTFSSLFVLNDWTFATLTALPPGYFSLLLTVLIASLMIRLIAQSQLIIEFGAHQFRRPRLRIPTARIRAASSILVVEFAFYASAAVFFLLLNLPRLLPGASSLPLLEFLMMSFFFLVLAYLYGIKNLTLYYQIFTPLTFGASLNIVSSLLARYPTALASLSFLSALSILIFTFFADKVMLSIASFWILGTPLSFLVGLFLYSIGALLLEAIWFQFFVLIANRKPRRTKTVKVAPKEEVLDAPQA